MYCVLTLLLLWIAPSLVESSGGDGGTEYRALSTQCSLPSSKPIKNLATCEKAAKKVQDKEVAAGHYGTASGPTVESKRVVGLTEATCTRDNAEHKWYFAEPDGASGETNFIDYICELAEHHYPVAMGPVMFFIFAMTIATFAQLFESCIPKHVPHPPHTVFLFLLGMGFSAIGFSLDKSSDGDNLFSYYVKGFATVDPHVIFWILLPPLLFEDAANSHWHVLFRVLPNALLVAVPGVIINTLMTGYLISGLFSSDNNAALSIFVSLLLGSILSATDPVAVIGTLHSLRAPDKLSSLIAGEALLNDGTAVVLFRIFFNVAKGLEEFEFGHALQRFLQLSFGGIGWGLFFSFGLAIAGRTTTEVRLAATRYAAFPRHA
eukprot:GEMP01017031.1.p1 GENE.GEMP01017031.1~~GEMP01017031.1.p1  ORF type:complete len:377 (+),score=56.38 GEMP01017031.1:519-1649(+)